jgi:hypothetical protein
MRTVHYLMVFGALSLGGCQQASDAIDKGKQLATDNIEVSCANADQKAPMSIQGINKNAFSASVVGKLVAKGDFSKASVLTSMAEAAQDHPIKCNGVADYTQLQLNFKDGQDGLAITAIKSYLGSKDIKLPYNVAELTKSEKAYKIVGLNSAINSGKVKPDYNPPIKTDQTESPAIEPANDKSPDRGTEINQNIDRKK